MPGNAGFNILHHFLCSSRVAISQFAIYRSRKPPRLIGLNSFAIHRCRRPARFPYFATFARLQVSPPRLLYPFPALPALTPYCFPVFFRVTDLPVVHFYHLLPPCVLVVPFLPFASFSGGVGFNMLPNPRHIAGFTILPISLV